MSVVYLDDSEECSKALASGSEPRNVDATRGSMPQAIVEPCSTDGNRAPAQLLSMVRSFARSTVRRHLSRSFRDMVDRPTNALHYLETAIEHLRSIDDTLSPQAVLRHCHFALIFLELGIEQEKLDRT